MFVVLLLNGNGHKNTFLFRRHKRPTLINRIDLFIYFFLVLRMRDAQSDETINPPAIMIMSFITSRPAADR